MCLPAALSCSSRPPWEDLITLAKIISKVLHSVNRLVQERRCGMEEEHMGGGGGGGRGKE